MSAQVWRIIPGVSIESVCWDQQIVLFNKFSGDTHLLNQPVDWVLEQIFSSPRSLNELVDLAIDAGIIVKANDNRQIFAKLLETLGKIDLLEVEPT